MKVRAAVVLCYTSLVNHSPEPNCNMVGGAADRKPASSAAAFAEREPAA